MGEGAGQAAREAEQERRDEERLERQRIELAQQVRENGEGAENGEREAGEREW